MSMEVLVDSLHIANFIRERLSWISTRVRHCYLFQISDYQKTSSEKVREASLLQELLDTVSQRNLIVDSMEEDRIR